MHKLSTLISASALLGTIALPAAATVTKTWVSSTGTDSGTCQLVAPCKTFAFAVSQTAAGGEIDVKDSGAYGAFTITQAISIVADGVVASIGVPQDATGIEIDAGSADKVVLRGLTIDGHGVGSIGIRMVSVGTLLVEKSTVSNLTDCGLNLFNNGTVVLKDNTINGSYEGIFVYAFNNSVYIGGNTITSNVYGIQNTVHSYGDNYINGNTSCDVCRANVQLVSRQ